MYFVGGEQLAVLRRLAAGKARVTSRDHFVVQQTCTDSIMQLFKDKKAIFEGLIKDSCSIRDGDLSVRAESVILTVRKKRKASLYIISAKVHVRRELNID